MTTTYTYPTDRLAGRLDFTSEELADADLMLAVERADMDAVLAAEVVVFDEPDEVVEILAEATGARVVRRYL